jgi:hypothetical protein
MAVLGSAALLQAEIDVGLEVFKLLEPEIQKGLIALFHLFHHKQQISYAQFLAEAPTEVQQAKTAQPEAQGTVGGPSGKDLSSTSLNPDMSSTD